MSFTIIAIWTVDKLGRKPLMIIGSAGMGLSLFDLARPDALLADHSPTALLAARVAGLPANVRGLLLMTVSTTPLMAHLSIGVLTGFAMSGAMFPLEPTHTVMVWIGRLNPMSYAVTVVKGGFEGAPAGELLLPAAVLVGVTLAAVALAIRTCRRSGSLSIQEGR